MRKIDGERERERDRDIKREREREREIERERRTGRQADNTVADDCYIATGHKDGHTK